MPRKWRASSTIWCSLTPRLTTQFTLTGIPTACAASIPSSTRETGKSTSFIARKIVVVERVEADGDALEAGVLERLRLLRQRRGVGRQRQVDRQRREHLDQALDADAQERLAAGEAELRDADVDRCAQRAA